MISHLLQAVSSCFCCVLGTPQCLKPCKRSNLGKKATKNLEMADSTILMGSLYEFIPVVPEQMREGKRIGCGKTGW